MKKFLLSFSLIGIAISAVLVFVGRTAQVSANTDCKEVEFANGITACVNIEDA